MKAKRVIYLFLAVEVSFITGCAGIVPIGGVINWYRPNASFPVPDNYMIADGSTVTDQNSPLFNETLPDLRSKFVRGAATLNEIGIEGGVATHSHESDMPAIETTIGIQNPHTHEWARYNDSNNQWKSFNGSVEVLLVDWGDGIGNEGTGIWPLGFDEDNQPSGDGWYVLYTKPQPGLDTHDHNVELSGDVTMDNSPNEPPYVTLLKIVRIK